MGKYIKKSQFKKGLLIKNYCDISESIWFAVIDRYDSDENDLWLSTTVDAADIKFKFQGPYIIRDSMIGGSDLDKIELATIEELHKYGFSLKDGEIISKPEKPITEKSWIKMRIAALGNYISEAKYFNDIDTSKEESEYNNLTEKLKLIQQ